MNRITKLLAILAVLVMIVSCYAACGGESSTGGTENNGGDTAKVEYTVTWKDEAGNVLSTAKVEEGKTPTAYTYTKADTAEWDYTVNGWSATQGGEVLSSLPAINGDVTYYAVVSAVKKSYTVTFNTGDGTKIDAVTVEYGTTVNAPSEKPTCDGYKFVAWCTDSDCTSEVAWPLTVTGNVTVYAKWNEKVDIGAYLSALLAGYEYNPYSIIPETMRPDYAPNLISSGDVVTDYSNFVNVSDITMRGFGEQWQMVLDNIEQSTTFFNALSVVEGVSASAITAFNNYLDSNPGSTAHHSFMSGIYSVTIDFDGETIVFVMDYTATFPLIGEQSAQIYMGMDIETGNKVVRVQLGDANALVYSISDEGYIFAIKYLGVRRAMFNYSYDDDGNVNGHIYEFLTVSGVGLKSAADFYFTEDYAAIVGNKADGIPLMDNYICEVYDVSTGKMMGYEVREEKSVLSFDTLWFNLDQLSGINSIKYDSANSVFYVNGSSKAWSAKKVSTLNVSRRFDIEFRLQYFYSYDASTKEYTVHKVEVPMLFVQEGNFSTLEADIKSENNITVKFTESTATVNAIKTLYAGLVPVFAENKEAVTEELIVELIGDKVTFD